MRSQPVPSHSYRSIAAWSRRHGLVSKPVWNVLNFLLFLATDHNDHAFQLAVKLRKHSLWLLHAFTVRFLCSLLASFGCCLVQAVVKSKSWGLALRARTRARSAGMSWGGSFTLVGVSMTLANSHPLIVTYCLTICLYSYDSYAVDVLGSSHFIVACRDRSGSRLQVNLRMGCARREMLIASEHVSSLIGLIPVGLRLKGSDASARSAKKSLHKQHV